MEQEDTKDDLTLSPGYGMKRVRSNKRKIPDTEKDATYWSKRQRNNEAARKSRHNRRMVEQQMQNQLLELQAENAQLRAEMSALRKYYDVLFHKKIGRNADAGQVDVKQESDYHGDYNGDYHELMIKHHVDVQNAPDNVRQILKEDHAEHENIDVEFNQKDGSYDQDINPNNHHVKDPLDDDVQHTNGYLGILKEARLVDTDSQAYQLILAKALMGHKNMVDYENQRDSHENNKHSQNNGRYKLPCDGRLVSGLEHENGSYELRSDQNQRNYNVTWSKYDEEEGHLGNNVGLNIINKCEESGERNHSTSSGIVTTNRHLSHNLNGVNLSGYVEQDSTSDCSSCEDRLVICENESQT